MYDGWIFAFNCLWDNPQRAQTWTNSAVEQLWVIMMRCGSLLSSLIRKTIHFDWLPTSDCPWPVRVNWLIANNSGTRTPIISGSQMTLRLFISSISSNIFNIFVNLLPPLIAFFSKNIGYSHGNTKSNYSCWRTKTAPPASVNKWEPNLEIKSCYETWLKYV